MLILQRQFPVQWKGINFLTLIFVAGSGLSCAHIRVLTLTYLGVQSLKDPGAGFPVNSHHVCRPSICLSSVRSTCVRLSVSLCLFPSSLSFSPESCLSCVRPLSVRPSVWVFQHFLDAVMWFNSALGGGWTEWDLFLYRDDLWSAAGSCWRLEHTDVLQFFSAAGELKINK